MINLDNVRLAGVTFGDCQKNLERFGNPETTGYALIREPDNPHDPNCIGVYVGSNRLGYLPKNIAAVLAPALDSGGAFDVKYVCRNEHPYKSTVGLTVKITKQ